MKTVVIEREHLGGICLNWGCIPTKALLRTAEVLTLVKHAEEFGLKANGVTFDLAKVIGRSRQVAGKLSSGVAFLLKKHKVAVIDGTARLKGKGVIAVKGKDGKALADVEAKHIIIATGARARSLPGLDPDGKLVWTYKEAMIPDITPKSLLVVGSGAIGIEFASFYNALGVKVTVVEIMDRILPVEDEEVSAFAKTSFEKQGMTIHTGAKIDKLEKNANSVKATLTLKDGKQKTRRVRARHPGGGHRRQCGELGPRRTGRESREVAYRHRRILPHGRAGPLRHRRCGGAALARAQGQP